MTRCFHEKFQTHSRTIYILTLLNFRFRSNSITYDVVFSRKISNSFEHNLYLNPAQFAFPFQQFCIIRENTSS